MTLEDVQSLIEAPSPAVLTTYRRDGSALTTPVWFRFHDGAFEVVLAEGDVKRQHLARTPKCLLVVFEALAVTPFPLSPEGLGPAIAARPASTCGETF